MKKNIIANFFGRFWGMISNFLFIPLYIKFLGFESYSIISFTLIIAGLIAILDAGLTATLSREFARSDNGSEEKLKVYKTLETTYYTIVIFSIFIVFSLADFISTKWLNSNTINSALITQCLRIYSVDIGFQLLFRFYMGGLLGLEKQVKANILQIFWGIFRNGIVVLIIFIVPKLEVFFLWQSTSTVIYTVLIKLVLDKTLYGKFVINIKPVFEKAVFARTWKFAGGMMLISVVSAINTQMDKVSISSLLSIDTLGYYTLALSMSNILVAIASPFSTALLPRFTFLYSEKKYIEASNLFYRFGLILSIVIFSIYSNMVFHSEKLFFIWTGDLELALKASVFLPILSFSYAMLSIVNIPFSIAISNGYTRLNNIIGIASLFITLPGYWIATRFYGAIGAASVFLIVQTLTSFIYFYFINKRYTKRKLWSDIYINLILKPLLISFGIAFLIQLIPIFVAGSRIISLLLIGFAILVTIIITSVIVIPFQEIKKIANTI